MGTSGQARSGTSEFVKKTETFGVIAKNAKTHGKGNKGNTRGKYAGLQQSKARSERCSVTSAGGKRGRQTGNWRRCAGEKT